MKRSSLPLLLVLAILLLIGGCSTCNMQRTFVETDEDVKAKWSEVQNQYQRRADLVPNLVKVVEKAADFEKSTLESVINARAKATSIQVNADQLTPEKLAEFQQAQGELSQALGRLMMVSERYPDLKVNQNFLTLQDQLESTDNRITVARKNFNESVQKYNVAVRTFPNNIFARMLGFDARTTFEADESAQRAPQIQ